MSYMSEKDIGQVNAERKYRFWFHYSKPDSKREGRNVLSLHWRDKCHRIHEITCHTPTESHARKEQPRCVMRGFATSVEFESSGGNVRAVVS